jgi:hypothetical protein
MNWNPSGGSVPGSIARIIRVYRVTTSYIRVCPFIGFVSLRRHAQFRVDTYGRFYCVLYVPVLRKHGRQANLMEQANLQFTTHTDGPNHQQTSYHIVMSKSQLAQYLNSELKHLLVSVVRSYTVILLEVL